MIRRESAVGLDYTKSEEDYQMVQKKGKYTVITEASSGIGYETAKAFAGREKNLVITAKRRENLEMLKKEI